MKRLTMMLVFLILLARDASAGRRWGSGTHSYNCGDSCPPMPTWAIVLVTLLLIFVFGGSFCWWWFITKDHSCSDCFCCCDSEPDYSQQRREHSQPTTKEPESELDKYLADNNIENPFKNLKPPVPDDVESGVATSSEPPPPAYDLAVGDVSTPFIVPNNQASQPSSMPQAGNSSLPYAVNPDEQPLYGNDSRPLWVDPKSAIP